MLLVLLVCALIAAWVFRSSPPKRPITNAPFPNVPHKVQKKRFSSDTVNFLSDAVKEFPGKVFQVWTSDGPEIIVPQELVDEVKRLPDSILSATEGVSEALQARLTTLPLAEDQPGHLSPEFIKTLLNKMLAKNVPGMQDVVNTVIPIHFGSYEGWTPIKVHARMVDITARITARVFIGPDLGTNTRWINTTKKHPTNIFIAAMLLKLWPRALRSIGRFFIPQMYMIWYANYVAQGVVKDVLSKRSDNETEDDVDNAIYRLWDILSEDSKGDYHFQGVGQLGLALGGIHTTARVLTEAMYNLAAYPEYVDILRKEVESIGLFSQTPDFELVGQMKMMDSFLKETMRLEGGGIVTFRRKVLQSFTLSDGTELLAGTYLSVPSSAISSNPSNFENPESFNGLRFYNQRHFLLQDDAQKLQLAAIDSKNMYFGAGRHACPGRFMASVEMKLILAVLVTRYDFCLKEGESRPQDFIFQAMKINRDKSDILIRNHRGLVDS